MTRSKKPFLKKLGEAVMEILAELVAIAVFFIIGAGILALVGIRDAVEALDSDLLVLLGALVVLATFGILFTTVAVIRNKKKKQQRKE